MGGGDANRFVPGKYFSTAELISSLCRGTRLCCERFAIKFQRGQRVEALPERYCAT
jgi:hypothetical protein